MNRLKQLESYGQSPWLDDLHRSLVRNGELEQLIREDGLKDMTSNPAIFEKAIGETDEYKDRLEELVRRGELDDVQVYETLAIEDIRNAGDMFRSVYEASGRRDGFVSLEVPPLLAHDTQRTVEEASRLWNLVEREKLMIKIPATAAGLPTIRRTIASNINVNVTLLFSIQTYEAVLEAYIAGLEELIERGGDPASVASVASFFLSWIDTAVDVRLHGVRGNPDPALVAAVTDRVAIASAKLACAKYKMLFSTPRWRALADKGARPQRLLWASTSPKRQSLPDTYYVDALVGPETVNAMPIATLNAFREHGKLDGQALESDLAGARGPTPSRTSCASSASTARPPSSGHPRATAAPSASPARKENRLWVRHFDRRGSAPGAARAPRHLQHHLADRAARVPDTRRHPSAAASTRGPGRVGSNPVSHQPWAIQPRLQAARHAVAVRRAQRGRRRGGRPLFPRHRAGEFRKFLDTVEKITPAELDGHVAMDNAGTHKTKLIRYWVAKRPRWHVHFTPTSASWINQVERFFGLLTQRQLRRGVHRSTAELEAAVRAFMNTHNTQPKPFRWTSLPTTSSPPSTASASKL